MKRGRRINFRIKDKIYKMVQIGMSFPEIAEALKFKSRQAVRWHYVKYMEWLKSKGLDKEKNKSIIEDKNNDKKQDTNIEIYY